MTGKTMAEWEAIRKQKQAIADAKRITYATYDDLRKHADACDNCHLTSEPTCTICDVGREILSRFADYEYCDMGDMKCARCGETWEECDWSETSKWEGEKMSCQNCGMIHVVESAEYKLEVKIVETGEYDPDYLPE